MLPEILQPQPSPAKPLMSKLWPRQCPLVSDMKRAVPPRFAAIMLSEEGGKVQLVRSAASAACLRCGGWSTLAYSRAVIFRDIHQGCANFEDTPMTSESVAGILGWIVAVAVLAMAVVYGPLGQFGKPSKPAVATQPAPTAPAAPASRGPVIREVPNQ